MLRARVRSCYTVRGSGSAAALSEPKRYSFKYARHQQHNEARQPSYIHDKLYGLFSNERNIAKSRRGLPHTTPLYTKHMGLWETDTDARTNRFFRSYVFGQRELHLLLGRPHGFEADEAAGRQGDSVYELQTDRRYKGITQPAITNLHYEPEWAQTLYRNNAHGNQLSNPRSPLTKEVLGPELLAIRDIKSGEHCQAWFDRLQYLIKLHYDAVGDIGEFKSRHTAHVHEFFVMFHDALSSFDFQDAYLLEQFHAVRPKELEDIFAVFLEMEANYVSEAHCPRCSLPFDTTRYCGEGDTTTPFRKHRGRWALHQKWGKEWYEVVMRRAEALWYRCTEDPYFGTTGHTQRQVEAMLRVYVRTKQRAKTIDFLHALRGSQEYLMGHVRLTEAMQTSVDMLLDSTPHQHLLTNSFQVESRAAAYTGEVCKVPHSPLQLRLDLEMNKYRRQQKEEGVVRVPPAQWQLDTSQIVPYTLDAHRRVTNWREVKEGIEKSFLASGLPKESYTSRQWREMLYWKDVLASRADNRAALEAARRAEEAKADPRTSVVFPDKHWYRVFDISPEALRPFGVSAAGLVFTATTNAFEDPLAVPYHDPISGVDMIFDTTPQGCNVYGGFESGDVLNLVSSDTGKRFSVVVVGVNTAPAGRDWALYGAHIQGTDAGPGLVALGTDCVDVRNRFGVEATGKKAVVTVLEGARRAREEHLGQIVGVRQGQLYVQWRLLKGGSAALDRSVATNMGGPEMVQQYRIQELSVEPLVEPPSWQTPFRNDFAEEHLRDLETAPFQQEGWASLIPGKYTPKVKRFGYAQHSTQDDFQTKEFKDRLLARQFFNNPQAFEVIPERAEKSVHFRGKWEYQRTQGLPSVDRNELENGWGEEEPMSNDEVKVIEQALHDISGRRPGNFVKSAAETSALRLNESWWQPLEFGWQEHNRDQMAFHDSTERKLIESSSLPFGGKVPPFGTSYGIGERIRSIAEDYAKGFGLGPHGHSPTHDTTHFNTLGSEDARVRTLGLSHPLVRIFDEKLGTGDPHAWALEQCSRDEANVRHVLLSLKEWREKGRSPSPLLVSILRRYLKVELEAFNSGLPEGVPRLDVRSTDGDGSDGNIWEDVNARRYALAYAAGRSTGDANGAYIPSLVQCAALGDRAAISDAAFATHLEQDVGARFQLKLAELAGKGIPSSILAQLSVAGGRPERSSGNCTPYVRVSLLARLLSSMHVTSEGVAVVTRGLANTPEHVKLSDDIVVPIALVLTWSGPQSTPTLNRGPRTIGSSRGGRSSGSNSVGSAVNKALHLSPSSGSSSDGKMIVQVLEELALRNDGFVMDIRYTIRENKRNPVLRQEFFNAFLPVFANNHKKIAELYEDYTEGKYVPNVTVAIEAFVTFLATLSKHPDAIPSVVEYFETDDSSGRHEGQYTQIKLLPPSVGSFVFDNVKAERIETANLFSRYGISAGPTRAPATGFIAASSKAFNYVASRRDTNVVFVTTTNDQGLQRALESSAHYQVISANPKLRLLLQSPNAIGLVVAFNRYFQRVMPMLSLYRGLLLEYCDTVPSMQYAAQNANRGLARVLEQEASVSIEQDFRRNTERYWRGVLEGRSGNDTGSSTPQQTFGNRNAGGSSGGEHDGGGGNRRQPNVDSSPQGGRPPPQRRAPSSGAGGAGLSKALGGVAAPRSNVQGLLDLVGGAKVSTAKKPSAASGNHRSNKPKS